MKKATLILIAIIYVGAIVIISIFGLKAVVWNEVIPVTKVECLNESDSANNIEVYINSAGKKVIKIPFTEPGDPETLTGTMVQLICRVSPDNATTKGVRYVYDDPYNRVTFVQDDKGNNLGLILISAQIYLSITVMSTDGSRVSTDIVVWAY